MPRRMAIRVLVQTTGEGRAESNFATIGDQWPTIPFAPNRPRRAPDEARRNSCSSCSARFDTCRVSTGSTRSQFLLNEELLIGRPFDTRAAELERTAIQSGGSLIGDCELVIDA